MDDDLLKEAIADGKAGLPNEEKLGRLTVLARQQLAIENEIEELQMKLEGRQKALKQVSETEIPTLMQEIAQRSVQLLDGRWLKITPFYGGKITDLSAYDWLEDHGKGEIVKVNMTVSCRLSDAETINKVMTTLHEAGISWDENQGVHPSTLKAFIKDQISSGEPIDRELFNVFTGWRSSIK